MTKREMFVLLVLTTCLSQSTAFETKKVDQEIGISEVLETLQAFGRTIESLQETVSHMAKDIKILQQSSKSDESSGKYQNTTIDELEVRVEQLEAELFETQNELLETQNDVLEVEAEVLEVEFSLQEVNEQVLNNADSIFSLSEVTSGHTEELAVQSDAIDVLESNTIELDDRIAFLENEHFEKSEAAFLVSLSSDVNIIDHAVVPFDVVHYDGGLNYNVSTNTYVVPTDGTYLFYATLRCSSDDDGGCGSRLLVDGDRIAFNNEAVTLDTDPWTRLVTSWALTEGQAVQFVTVAGNDIYGSTAELLTYFGGHLIV